jgi:hypothetical protein
VPSASDPRLVYLDSSAIVKLVVAEPETAALMAFLARWPHRAQAEPRAA